MLSPVLYLLTFTALLLLLLLLLRVLSSMHPKPSMHAPCRRCQAVSEQSARHACSCCCCSPVCATRAAGGSSIAGSNSIKHRASNVQKHKEKRVAGTSADAVEATFFLLAG
jgi:hypothetical protein